MDVFKIAVKLFVTSGDVASEQFIPVFQRWIQTQSMENHLLIDVADYAHVAGGPGTVLVASEANIHMDLGENRPGLLYSRKTSQPGSFADRLDAVMTDAFKAAAKLEQEPSFAGRISFGTSEIVIRLNDRLLAPNSQQTFAAVEADVRAVMSRILGKSVTLEPRIAPHTLFEIRVKTADSAPIKTLLNRL